MVFLAVNPAQVGALAQAIMAPVMGVVPTEKLLTHLVAVEMSAGLMASTLMEVMKLEPQQLRDLVVDLVTKSMDELNRSLPANDDRLQQATDIAKSLLKPE